MKLDLHIHSCERSACATVSEDEQIAAAIAAGLNGIAFTDHHCLVPFHQLEKLRSTYPNLRIFTGIEITVGEDILVLGLHHTVLESRSWDYPSLWKYVRSRGGYMILAHPFRYHPNIMLDLDAYPPDGIEVCSMNTPVREEGRIRDVAQQYHLRLFTNSDAHWTSPIGKYFNDFPGTAATDEELITLLRQS